MGNIVSDLFGGGSRDAARITQQGLVDSQKIVKQSVDEAKREIKPLFGSASEKRAKGTQQILNLLAGGIGDQFRFNQEAGNVATAQLLAGVPMFNNAILGTSLPDTSNIPMHNFSVGPNTFNIPKVHQPAQPVSGGTTTPPPPAVSGLNLSQLLSGGMMGGGVRNIRDIANYRHRLR